MISEHNGCDYERRSLPCLSLMYLEGRSRKVSLCKRVLIVVVAIVIIVCDLNSARIGIDKQTK